MTTNTNSMVFRYCSGRFFNITQSSVAELENTVAPYVSQYNCKMKFMDGFKFICTADTHEIIASRVRYTANELHKTNPGMIVHLCLANMDCRCLDPTINVYPAHAYLSI